jgi:predicted Zn-dependent protease
MVHVAARHWTRMATKNELTMGDPLAGRWVGAFSEQPPSRTLAFQRAQEREADYWAVKVMAAAGYDPSALSSYLERVQPVTHSGGPLETLPPRNERIAAMQAEIRHLPAGNYKAGDEFARVQAELK